jgi:hypothetical protein
VAIFRKKDFELGTIFEMEKHQRSRRKMMMEFWDIPEGEG